MRAPACSRQTTVSSAGWPKRFSAPTEITASFWLRDRDDDFAHFHLDGQTIVLDDYLEIRPENRERLKRHIDSGRILIGPWYLLNDMFLVSGEAIVRNLLLGGVICRQWGQRMPVGYMPDQFGHISQMPQILTQFGLDNAIIGRGISLLGRNDKMESCPGACTNF